MNYTSDEPLASVDGVLKSLKTLLDARAVPAEPPGEFINIDGFLHLYESLLEVRNAILATSVGDLNYPVRKKGYIAGTVKGLQASLRHLTWQTKAIASGDFTQRVDFMGEFSEAFNAMVKQLDNSMTKLNMREQELRKMAHTDPLTGVNNRGYFMELMAAELERSRRYGHVFSVMMTDLDNFKSVNDTRGHGAGDEALRTMARIVQTSGLRVNDFWGRIGGEEFAVVLPETLIADAVAVAERIRVTLAKTPVKYENEEFFITVSIGVSQLKTGDVQATLLSRADEALYRAKRTGRNKICQET
ncbi:MAG: GGDEF domain-containing protein [Nitrospirae bacterium]|nr:GGDEF domain-containing protein [Nitrospirota bacterium]MBF0534588.1 GGDEF domain-containing protein [Nitrospirota bacterium]MBF0616368.1 GGDEF domain-containing protein [Nitrospirota bacterium]